MVMKVNIRAMRVMDVEKFDYVCFLYQSQLGEFCP